MPLIVAIEPDRRQANQLNVMVRERLHAELVLADSAEGALAALGERVPDLILTSALLSPTDELVLGERLRAFDGAAAHVQTLTIPVLAAPRARASERARGVLSALRREKPRPTAPDGCDPAVFAAQCAEYLERARLERELAASSEELRTEAPEAERVADEPTAHVQERSVDEPFDEKPFLEEPLVEEPLVEAAVIRLEPTPVFEGAAIETVSQAIASLSRSFDEEFERNDQEFEQSIQEAVQEEGPVEPELPEGMIELDLSTFLDDGADAIEATEEEPEFYDLAMPIDVGDSGVEAEFVTAFGEPGEPVTIPALAERKEPVTVHFAPTASARVEKWAPTRLGVAQLWPPMEGAVAEARPVVTRDTVTPMPAPSTLSDNRGRRKGRPVQDEWGFFDPEQCGFAALIAKLDEIIESGDDVPRPRRPA